MGNENYFAYINVYSGYWQCNIADGNTPNIAFLIRYNLQEQIVMSMGLTNAPGMFLHTKKIIFYDILDFGVVVFVNYILIHSHTVMEHFILLKKKLAHLCQYILYGKFKNCSFFYNSTIFLDFNITPKHMQINESKVKILNKWLCINNGYISTVILRFCIIFV